MARKKNRRKGRQSALTGLLLFALFAVAAAVVLGSQVFVLRDVRVIGNNVIPTGDIIRKADLDMGGSIFEVDQQKVKRNFDGEGAVELCEVKIVLPDSVELVVRERARRCVVNYLGVSLVLDGNGVVMEQIANLPDYGIVVVTGVKATSYQVGAKLQSSEAGQVTDLCKVVEALYAQGVNGDISELNVANLDNMYLMMRSGMMVRIGDSEDMDNKLTWMKSVLNELAGEGVTTGIVDVSGGKSAAYSPS